MNKKPIDIQTNFAEKWSDSANITDRILVTHSYLSGFNEHGIIARHMMEQKHFIRINLLLISLFIIMLVFISTSTYANHTASRQYYIRGVAATGINDLCGVPLFSLTVPEAVPPTFHATILGEYDPDGEVPILLSPTNCNNDIIVATNTDTAFLDRVGLPDIDNRLKNIPLRDVPVISNSDGTRSVIPTLQSVTGNAFPPTKSNPNEDITLGD